MFLNFWLFKSFFDVTNFEHHVGGVLQNTAEHPHHSSTLSLMSTNLLETIPFMAGHR
jgi:hypothetical protein